MEYGVTMSKYANLFAQIANWLIWFMITLGALVVGLLIPITSQELQNQYDEFKGDALAIQLLTSLITLSCMVVLLAISRLLSRIRFGGLHSSATQRWVNALAGSAFALAISIVLLFAWLSSQNAVPPIAGLGVVVGAPLAATVGFITLALKNVLLEATADRNELEGVI